MPPPSSPVPRLSFVPSDVYTVHTIASRSPLRPLVPALSERTGGHLVRFWAMSSPPHRHRSTSNQKGSASCCLSSCPPRPLPRPLPLHQVVRVGQTTIQGGPPLSAHPADPLHPAGVPRHKAVKFCLSSENQGHCRAAGALFQAKGKHSNTFSQLIKSLTEKRGRGIKYSKIAAKNKNNNYSVRNINFSPNFNRKIQSFS